MRGDVGHPVRQREERRDRGDVPDVVVAEAVAGDVGEILLPTILFASPLTFIAKSSMARWRGVMSALR